MINKKIFFSILLSGALAMLCSCSFNKQEINSEKDNELGKKFLNSFYQNALEEKYNLTDLMVSDTLRLVLKDNSVSKIQQLINRKLGKYKGYSVTEFESKRSIGSVNVCLYKYKLNVSYEKGVIAEVIGLIEKDNKEPKILSYNVYSDLLVNKPTAEDMKEARRFLDKFYANIKNHDFDQTNAIITDSLKQLAGINGLGKLLKQINAKVGAYKGYVVDDFYSEPLVGKNELSLHYKLKVSYEKGVVDEIIGLKKIYKDKIEMNSYHANSDLLIK